MFVGIENIFKADTKKINVNVANKGYSNILTNSSSNSVFVLFVICRIIFFNMKYTNFKPITNITKFNKNNVQLGQVLLLYNKNNPIVESNIIITI
jgi:hypothetical protein